MSIPHDFLFINNQYMMQEFVKKLIYNLRINIFIKIKHSKLMQNYESILLNVVLALRIEAARLI